MKLKKAEIINKPDTFSQGVCRIARADALPNEWSMYRLSFESGSNTKGAELLIMGADYFSVYINGEFCTEYSIRSYVFHRAYEIYDVSDYLKDGKNVISILACEKGNPKNRGFACELKMLHDDRVISISEGWKTTKCEAIVGTLTYTLGPATEIYDARKELDSWMDVNFDDSAWQPAEIVGAVDCPPYTNLVQSFQKAQTRDEIAPLKAACFEDTDKYTGYDVCLAAPGNSYSTFMTTLTSTEDAVIAIAPTTGVSSVSLDGQAIVLNTDIPVSAGVHTLSIANHGGGKTMFQIRTHGEITFSNPMTDPNDADCPWILYSVPKPPLPYRIGWNEQAPKLPIPAEISYFMEAPDFVSLPDSIQKACIAAASDECDLWHDILHRKNIGIPDCFDPLSGEKIIIPARDTSISLMLDYGREHVGLFTLDVDAPQGTEITYFMFEMITPSGIRYMGNHIGNHGKYICRGGHHKFISNRRRGFRYAVITVPACNETITLFGANVIETRCNAEPAGAFTSNDEYLNGIYQMSIDTAKVCMMDSYVDCCGCEQNTWVGDAGITAEINMVNFGKQHFDARYLDMIGRSMEDGMLEFHRRGNPRYIKRLQLPCSCFPSYPEGGIPIWSFTWVLQILQHYMYFGADEALERGLADIDECFARCRLQTNDRGLFEVDEAWNLIEWADNDLMTCGEVTANNIMLAYCLIEAAKLLRDLGQETKAKEYEQMGRAYRETVNSLCWDETEHAYVDTVRDENAYAHYVQHCKNTGRTAYTYEEYLSCGRISVQTNTFALLYDCVPEERKPYCIDILLKSVETGKYLKGTPANVLPFQDKKLVEVGSPFFLYFTLKALYKLGYHDLATGVIRRDWGDMYDDGFTTCVETFRGTDGEWGRSVAHAWSASPAIFLMTEVLGIKPVKSGYTEFAIEPHPAGLSHASGAVPTPYGNIYVEWTCQDGKLDIKCLAPKECKRIK